MSLRVSGSISVLTLPLARMGQERGSNAEDPPHAHAKCRLRHVGARCIVRLLPGGSNAEPPPVRSRAALLDRVGRGGPMPRAPPTRAQNADCGTWACMTLLPPSAIGAAPAVVPDCCICSTNSSCMHDDRIERRRAVGGGRWAGRWAMSPADADGDCGGGGEGEGGGDGRRR